MGLNSAHSGLASIAPICAAFAWDLSSCEVVLAVLEQDGPLFAIAAKGHRRTRVNDAQRQASASTPICLCRRAHVLLCHPWTGKERAAGCPCGVRTWMRSPLRYLRTTDLQSAIYRSLARRSDGGRRLWLRRHVVPGRRS